MGAAGTPVTPDELVRTFKGARAASVKEMLSAMQVLGQARLVGEDRYAT
jgi:hypothetical protein